MCEYKPPGKQVRRYKNWSNVVLAAPWRVWTNQFCPVPQQWLESAASVKFELASARVLDILRNERTDRDLAIRV